MVEIAHPIRQFADFWPFYVGEHKSPTCRALHYIGTSLFLLQLATFAVTGNFLYLGLGIVSGYAFAWVGHFVIEKNRPATFRYPFFSLAADFKMLGYAVTGRMDREVTRLYGSARPERGAPLLRSR